jgi:hypothetical protein
MSAILRLACAAFVLFAAPVVRAQTTDCTEITELPYDISAPGIYCLKRSLSLPLAQGSAVRVQVDDVTIDLNGHILANFPGSTFGRGITGFNRKRVTVRNGTIRDFEIGIYFENSAGLSMGHLMEDLVVERSKHSGIIVDGKHSVIRNNRIMETGSMVFAYGIFAAGEGVHVIGNVITGIVEASGGEAAAITAYGATGGAVERNVVGNRSFGPTRSFGIVVSGGTSRITLAGNRIINMRTGIHALPGVALYLDNSVGGATTPFTGGVMAGSTNYSF